MQLISVKRVQSLTNGFVRGRWRLALLPSLPQCQQEAMPSGHDYPPQSLAGCDYVGAAAAASPIDCAHCLQRTSLSVRRLRGHRIVSAAYRVHHRGGGGGKEWMQGLVWKAGDGGSIHTHLGFRAMTPAAKGCRKGGTLEAPTARNASERNSPATSSHRLAANRSWAMQRRTTTASRK